jgi:hypothetical protein
VQDLPGVVAAHRRVRVLVGGPGWEGVEAGPVTAPRDLAEAVAVLERVWRGGQPPP